MSMNFTTIIPHVTVNDTGFLTEHLRLENGIPTAPIRLGADIRYLDHVPAFDHSKDMIDTDIRLTTIYFDIKGELVPFDITKDVSANFTWEITETGQRQATLDLRAYLMHTGKEEEPRNRHFTMIPTKVTAVFDHKTSMLRVDACRYEESNTLWPNGYTVVGADVFMQYRENTLKTGTHVDTLKFHKGLNE